jgi:hypothetical protein
LLKELSGIFVQVLQIAAQLKPSRLFEGAGASVQPKPKHRHLGIIRRT